MDLDTYIVNVFCLVDDVMKTLFQDQKLRKRGSEPTLGDSEVIIAGEKQNVRFF